MQVMVYTPAMQAVGAFDGGNITEQKPIGFPGEGSVVKGVGPLFYWAWAHTKQEGYIGLHPHQGFEIITYVVEGTAEHGDTLGTRSTVGPGGAQVMQTGSGVSHEERFIGPDMEGFQIWFEPYLSEAVKRQPTYSQFEHEAFPITSGEGYTVKTVIGGEAPIKLVAEARMWDVEVGSGGRFTHTIPAGHTLTALAIRGDAAWHAGDAVTAFPHKSFALLRADQDTEVTLEGSPEAARVILIEVPTKVDYPLYPKR
ncbi:pirin family protein [Paenibacillus filicis]|uniref:Pirin family protein n=1 Tax=Paenibacillus gyeongsangnamensis TaxID=3388067 RepID=A0ABT4QAJ8_9BACL|nr:pirin family protein [Paenibacillus filicis]MCZ8513919.1 pirin family protein [Paenibacillus filicis]